MKVNWAFTLNTEKPETAKKLVHRVDGFLGAKPENPVLKKYYKV